MILLRVVPLILLRVVLQVHSILAGNHDFAARGPIDFAVCSPPVIIIVRTERLHAAESMGLHAAKS